MQLFVNNIGDLDNQNKRRVLINSRCNNEAFKVANDKGNQKSDSIAIEKTNFNTHNQTIIETSINTNIKTDIETNSIAKLSPNSNKFLETDLQTIFQTHFSIFKRCNK